MTITINATVNSNAGGTTISNQGTIFYDADGDGTNEATSLTDDPSTVAANDPTVFSVCQNNLIVTTNADSGPNSLRQAIADACPGATITFDMSQVVSPITLASELVINKNLTVTGPGTNLLTISGNNASRVINIQSGTVAISDVTIANGKVTSGSSAGGVLNKGTLTLTNCTVTGNSAANAAGGISNNGDNGTAVLTINNCTISGNTAPSFGAGILSSGFQGSATLNILNSTISGNGAPSFGGGIYNFGDAGIANLNITNSTISGNSAASAGGGIFSQGNGGAASITLSNALISDNSGPNAASGPDILSQFGGTVSGNNNLIQTSTGYTITGSNNINGDPRLEKDGLGKPLLKNNGGATQTIALLAGSPAVDAGSNTAANNAGLTTDQRGPGFARIVDGADADTTDTVDIGAFEAQLSLQDITDKATNEDTQLQFTFNVGGVANITSVTATSANTTLVPNNAANIDVSGSGSTRTLTIYPVADLSGTSTITVTVTGSSETMTDTFVLTVNPVNDAPSFIKGANQTVNEDVGAQSAVNWATSISPGPNESGQTVSFTATNDNNALFSAQPAISSTGTLTYTPAANASGSATVSVTLKDNGGTANGGVDTSAPQTFTITVNPVADTPSVTNATTTLNTQTTSGLVISRNAGDGAEVTNFKITNIQHGTLFKNNGTAQINEGEFITVAEGNAGLKFTPASNLISPATTFSFDVNSSLSNSNGGIGGGTTTATITVNCGSTVVTNNADNGPGSLRAVINSACAGSVITFDMNQVINPITLTSDEIVLDRSLTLQGPGANVLTIRRSAAAGTPLFRFFHIFDPAVTTNISGLTLSNADSTNSGGAIRNFGTLIVNGVTFSNNHTPNSGSAIFNTGSNPTVTVSNSTFSGNRADGLAAIYNDGGLATISNTTLTGNANLGAGPGTVIFNQSGSFTNVTNCTISQNTGQSAALFHNGGGPPGELTLKNSIVSGNTGGNVSGITDNGNNIIGGAPLLAPLGDYGGPTQTMALLPGSPAINAGTSTGAPATDQRGISRVGAVDIGAFESRGFTIAATSGSGQTTPILTAFALPLTATVNSAFAEPVAGGLVTFNAPGSGASSTFPGNVTTTSVSISATGAAVLSPTANGIAGSI